MGKGKTPTYNPPKPPTLPTAQELYSQGTQYAQQNSPLAFGAREGALKDLQMGSDYYQSFQPTSFEQALGNQYFQNVWPDTEQQIKHGLSISGLDTSPILAQELGRARGELGYNIGSYLSDLGNQRAQYSLSSRLSMDPNSMVQPYVQTGMNQGNAQAGLDYSYAQALAEAEYQSAMNDYNNKLARYRTIGMISPLGGAIYGGIDGGWTGFGQSFGGTMEMAKNVIPMITGMGGFGGGGASQAVSSVRPANYSSGFGTPSYGSQYAYSPSSNPYSIRNSYGWGL